MSIFDKRISKEERASLEMAEDSRQGEWKYPSFTAQLFQGKVEWGLVFPFSEQSKAEKEAGDKFIAELEVLLKSKLDPNKVDESREIPQDVINELFKMGAFAIKIPKEYGGLGFSQTNYNRIVHLIGSYCGSTAALISAHQSIGVPQPLKLFGTDEQKKKFLPRFRKDAISAFALTEPLAGSDPRTMQTTATPTEDGKHYLINGEKLWCTNGNVADILVVMAQTPPKMVHGKERKQISAFIVETNTPGFEVTYRCNFMGLRAIQNGILKFDNVKVPKENLILGEGDGLKLAFITLNTGRLTLPAAVTGASKWCVYVARTWAVDRKQWGGQIGDLEAVAAKLAYMASTTFAMDAVTWLVSSMADNERFDIRLEAAMAKLFCTEESWKIVDQTMQIRAGRGYETGPSLAGRGKAAYPVERAMRDARVNTILEGSSEIMHLFIAREALDFHLQKIKVIFSSRASIGAKLKAALDSGLAYLRWYPALWIPFMGGSKVVAAKPLQKHLGFVRKASRRLAREIFHKMMLHQKKLASKQHILNRFVDIGVDLFAMSSACSYADHLLKKGEKKENSIDLAVLFCKEAEARIKANFHAVHHNHDKASNAVSKNLIAGKYAWLETDIIKGE